MVQSGGGLGLLGWVGLVAVARGGWLGASVREGKRGKNLNFIFLNKIKFKFYLVDFKN